MRVVIYPTFERALDAALEFLLENDAQAAAEQLLNRALDDLPEMLAQFPRIGRDFLARNPETPQIADAQEQVRVLLGQDIELREFVLDDYLALYAIKGKTLYLLGLRHHRQSAFSLGGT